MAAAPPSIQVGTAEVGTAEVRPAEVRTAAVADVTKASTETMTKKRTETVTKKRTATMLDVAKTADVAAAVRTNKTCATCALVDHVKACTETCITARDIKLGVSDLYISTTTRISPPSHPNIHSALLCPGHAASV